jgi:hypothetical protein
VLSTRNAGPAAGPRDFDIVIDLRTPFLYDPSAGNLLLESRKFPGTTASPDFFRIDAHAAAGDSTSYVAIGGGAGGFDDSTPNSAVADEASTGGMVVRFTTTPAGRAGAVTPDACDHFRLGHRFRLPVSHTPRRTGRCTGPGPHVGFPRLQLPRCGAGR